MSSEASVPELRVRALNSLEVDSDAQFVLYWMVANRRTRWNFALQRTAEYARDLGKPLVILEALRCDYRWASDRFHWFVIQGMADNARRLEDTPAIYYPYLEPEPGADHGLLMALANKASVVVSDDFPCFFLPRMQAKVAERLPVKFEVVDSNGLLPMRATYKVFSRAYDLRRYLQKELPNYLTDFPDEDPLQELGDAGKFELPEEITERWPVADPISLAEDAACLADFPIDHSVEPAVFDGGEQAAKETLKTFLSDRIDNYGEQRNHPEKQATSGLSPYLHFGHISVHEVFSELMDKVDWNINKLSHKANGSRSGWWGTGEAAESFLDELITWRELGYNMCSKTEDYTRYSSLPDWAQETLAEHADDEREFIYSLEQFEKAETHDELWNAAQMQLVTEGRMHNYLRMLWGKKILHWSSSPQEALRIMIELNNKYAVDGRNPNSYSGIFWVLGRYDRAWGPERPIFGKIRYMTSDSTRRKFKVDNYIEKFAKGQSQMF